ncbi:MAG: SAM-dependent DNA methyltransferase [Bryobacterales bacterium]|nr:SAM-dependent DNA methyltransferase [Bryobacterales bacterium]
MRSEGGDERLRPNMRLGRLFVAGSPVPERRREERKSLSLYGQEMNLNTWAICKMNLFLHDVEDAFIQRGDTLRRPMHLVAEGSEDATAV